MLKLIHFVSCIILLHLVSSAPDSAPWKKWTYCKEVEPNKDNECLLTAVDKAADDMLPGNSYFGTPDLDPIEITELTVYQAGQDRPISLNITFNNVKISGFTKRKFQELRSDWNNGKVSGVAYFKDPINFEADYKISGKVILLPITGQGKAHIELDEMTVPLTLNGKITEKKNKKYFVPETFGVDLQPKLMKVQLDNLFNGNKALGDNMNKFLNENWKDLLKEVKPSIEKGLGEVFKQLSIRVFSKIPMDVIVPK